MFSWKWFCISLISVLLIKRVIKLHVSNDINNMNMNMIGSYCKPHSITNFEHELLVVSLSFLVGGEGGRE